MKAARAGSDYSFIQEIPWPYLVALREPVRHMGWYIVSITRKNPILDQNPTSLWINGKTMERDDQRTVGETTLADQVDNMALTDHQLFTRPDLVLSVVPEQHRQTKPGTYG